jgi:hypothetical protein
MKLKLHRNFWVAILWLLVLPVLAFSEPTDAFLCRSEWDGQKEAELVFENDGKTVVARLNPTRSHFLADGKPIGWSELLPNLPAPPIPVFVHRSKFRWSLIAGRRLIAFAFADEPATRKWTGLNTEDFSPVEPLPERYFIPSGGWKQVDLDDGSVAFRPPERTLKGAFPLVAGGEVLTDLSATLAVRPNGARAVGLGICWGEDGGYLWRWVRERGEMKWQLAVAKPFDSGWDLMPLYEEPATVAPTEWHRLQVWRSGDQIWVGVDGEVSANLRDNRFAFGQIIVWVEIGDLPPPLVRPVRLNRWWCASLSADIDANEPFPARLGEWKTKADGWTLQTSTGQPFALSLLGAPDLPAWWVADILWRNETFGLVFGWLDENHYHLLRLRPYEKTAEPHRAVLELVAIRQSRETILDKWDLLLESGGVYRLALQMAENQVSGFINGMGLVRAEISPVGKVGLWTNSSLNLKRFWLYIGEESLLSLAPEMGGTVQPLTGNSIIAHEVVSITLPAGLPPGVPLSARLSQEPVILLVERRGNRLVFQVERQGRLLGVTSTSLPSQVPITIRLERRDRLLLVWLGNQPVWTLRLP